MSNLRRRPGDRKAPGRLHGVDYRLKVGSAAFHKQPVDLQHKAAWRHAHSFPGGHAQLHRFATIYKGKTSARQLTTADLMHYIKSRGG